MCVVPCNRVCEKTKFSVTSRLKMHNLYLFLEMLQYASWQLEFLLTQQKSQISSQSADTAYSVHCCCCCLVAKSCLTLLQPHGLWPARLQRISQARILEWVAISFSRESSQPRGQPLISCLAGRFFTTEPPGKFHPVHSIG